jgi:hypothetical protein
VAAQQGNMELGTRPYAKRVAAFCSKRGMREARSHRIHDEESQG